MSAGVLPAAVSVYLSPEGLARRSPLIVEGVVQRTASGLDPETGELATYITLQVDHVHRGPAQLRQVVLRELGGEMNGLANDVDAVPIYEPGERVLVFLEPGPRRALRTTGMFFGKFLLEDEPMGGSRALRDLSGQGRIFLQPTATQVEEFPAGDIAAVVATVPRQRQPGRSPAWTAFPEEWDRLQWHGVQVQASPDAPVQEFQPLSTVNPARWYQWDSDLPVAIDVETAGNPLGDAPAAVAEIVRALEVWTQAPDSRIFLQLGNGNADFVATHASSPGSASPGANIVLFDDPYDDIADPSGCGGVLAVGGYWRMSSPQKMVNNVLFKPETSLYVIFNNAFECFLGTPDNLAEVATHELGHGIGFGHSTVPDAIMRGNAYGNRGPRLGDDDHDLAHCHYPHTFDVIAPDGGEILAPASVQQIVWTATGEQGPNPGWVDIELSLDDGGSWSVLSAGEPNDGSMSWTVPGVTSAAARVRVIRHNLVIPTPAPYPGACSQAVSDAAFVIGSVAAPVAGTVPDGASSQPLEIVPAAAGDLTVTWGASCSGQEDGYALYEGSLQSLWSGVWDPLPIRCGAAMTRTETLTPAAGSRYYLVAPLAGVSEGGLGLSSAGTPRPAPTATCQALETAVCP